MKQQTDHATSDTRQHARPAALLLVALWLAAVGVGGCGSQPAPPQQPPAAVDGAGSATAARAGDEPAAGVTNGQTPEQTVLGAAAAGQPEDATTGTAATADAGAGVPGAAPPAAATGGEQPPVPDATPGLALAAPSELLDSYRIEASYIITSLLPNGERRIESTQLQGAWQRTAGPFGFDAAFSLTNVSGSRRQALGVVAVGDAVAIQSEGAWSTVARDASLPFVDPDRLLSLPFITQVNQGEDLGQETMAGVNVTHYRLTDPQTLAAAEEALTPPAPGSVREVLLEGWVADAGYVVRYLLQAELMDAPIFDDNGSLVRGQQEVSASYVLSDLDRVAAIEWPADAQPPNTVSVPGFVPNTFPLPENARVTPRLGMVEIRTAAAEGEIAAFYRARLQELGWTFEGELGFYSAEKAGQRLRLTILPDEVAGEIVVRVFAAGE